MTESHSQPTEEHLRQELLKKNLKVLKKKCKSLRISAQGNKTEIINKIIQQVYSNSKSNEQNAPQKPICSDLQSNKSDKSNKNKKIKRDSVSKNKNKRKRKKTKKKQKIENNSLPNQTIKSINQLANEHEQKIVINPNDTSIAIQSTSNSWTCLKCTFVNVLPTILCAMCQSKQPKDNEQKKNEIKERKLFKTHGRQTEIVALLVSGYVNNCQPLLNNQIIPTEVTALCFNYYYLTVKQWLQCVCCLPRYLHSFIDNGFNELSFVAVIESNEYLQKIGIISKIDRNQIWNELAKLKQNSEKYDKILRYHATSYQVIERWLQSFGLAQYFEGFDEYCYDHCIGRFERMIDDIESTDELEQIGVKLKGHQVKIWDEINKLKAEYEEKRERARQIKEKEKEMEQKKILEQQNRLKLIREQKEREEQMKLKREIRQWEGQKGNGKNIAYLYNDDNARKLMVQNLNLKKDKIKRCRAMVEILECWCVRMKSATNGYIFDISRQSYLCASCRAYQLPSYDDAI